MLLSLPPPPRYSDWQNLRAQMYNISPTALHEVRRLAGSIVPVLSTTTSVVAGIAAIELVKYATCRATDAIDSTAAFRNTFLNLSAPLVLHSEPAPCKRTGLPSGQTFFTVWDRWDIDPSVTCPTDWRQSYRLRDFMQEIKVSFLTQRCRLLIKSGQHVLDQCDYHTSGAGYLQVSADRPCVVWRDF